MSEKTDLLKIREKQEKNFLKVLESLGDLLQQRETELYLANINIESLGKKVEKAEEELRMTREALNQACAENEALRDKVARYEMPPAGEWDITPKELKGA